MIEYFKSIRFLNRHLIVNKMIIDNKVEGFLNADKNTKKWRVGLKK